MRGRLAVLALLFAVCAPTTVRADAIDVSSAEGLRAAGRSLRSEAKRSQAIAALCSAPASSLEAIRGRIAQIRGERAAGDSGYAALSEFAEAAGASSQSDPRDLLPGIASFPDERFSNTHATVAERYCLVRSLERMATADALVVAGPLLTFDIRAFRWQARHLVRRSERRATAMLIRSASIPNAEVDLWADWGLAVLGLRASGDSVQGQTDESLIAVLRAYAAMRHVGGMPVVGSFVDDRRPAIRAAAREAFMLYGENSIWELRRLYQTRLGADPGNRSWQLLARELWQQLDDRRETPLRDRATRALRALAAGKLDDAARIADALVAEVPLGVSARRVAPVYLAVARSKAALGDADAARSSLEQSLRLGLEVTDDVRSLQGELSADRLSRHGIYEAQDARATRVLASPISGALIARRRLARFGLALAFLLLAGSLLVDAVLRGRRMVAASVLAVHRNAVAVWFGGTRERLISLAGRSGEFVRDTLSAARVAVSQGTDQFSTLARDRRRDIASAAPLRAGTELVAVLSEAARRATSIQRVRHSMGRFVRALRQLSRALPASASASDSTHATSTDREPTATPSPQGTIAQHPQATPIRTTAVLHTAQVGPHDSSLDRDARQPVRQAASHGPEGGAEQRNPEPSASSPVARRPRPTRRAVADAGLFISSEPKRVRNVVGKR